MNITLDRIELINFQLHSKLEIDFVKGVNVICGESRKGKSCLRRSIDWLVFNAKIDSIRKEGTKKTSVKGFFSNGVILEKVRSQSINRYILSVPGKNDQQFDSIGKEIPEEIKKAINLNPIEIDKHSINLNIANQIALPFLWDKPASTRMKLFNLLTGNDLQDNLLSSFNKSILNIGRQLKSQEENLVDAKKDLKEVDKEKVQFKQKVVQFSIVYEKLNVKKEKLKKLTIIKDNLDINEEEIEILSDSISKLKVIDIKIISKGIDNAKKLDILDSLSKSIQNNQKEVESVNNLINNVKIVDIQKISGLFDRISKFNTLKSLRGSILSHDNEIKEVGIKLGADRLTEVNCVPLMGKIERLNTLKSNLDDNNQINEKKENLTDILEEIEIELESQGAEYAKLLKKVKICPFSGNPITGKCLEGVKL